MDEVPIMIQLMSQLEAEQSKLPPSSVQCISPFLNPAHVLAPPRHWLDLLVSGQYSWAFFRLRYKNLLKKRREDDPDRFESLLDVSEGKLDLILTCHCLSDHCHRSLAREFLEQVRHERTKIAKRNAVAHQPPPARDWAHRPDRGLVLSALIESPQSSLNLTR